VPAGGANGAKGIPDQLQAYLNAALNGGIGPIGKPFPGFFPSTNIMLAGGDWKVVWGPSVYCALNLGTDFVADNSMYVAHSQNLATCVVAIDGTNPNSTYDANKEDDWVDANCMAKWPFAVPFFPTLHDPWKSTPPPAVSAGSAIGISNLLRMTDTVKEGPQSFLTNVASATCTLIFAGHSLAGALSPTLALYLYPEPQNSGWKQILVLPTAGRSPGNEPFTKLFGTAYPPVSSGVDPLGGWDYLDGYYFIRTKTGAEAVLAQYQEGWGYAGHEEDLADSDVVEILDGPLAPPRVTRQQTA
jgi:hypothetical protein